MQSLLLVARLSWGRFSIVALAAWVSTFTYSPANAQDLKAESIYAWQFQRTEDRDSDQMPDGWKRRFDRQHPSYVDMRIVPCNPQLEKSAIEAQQTMGQWWQFWQTGKLGYIETIPEPISNFVDRFIVDQCLQINMDGASAELVGPVVPLDSRYIYTLEASAACDGLDGHTAVLELLLFDEQQQPVGKVATPAAEGSTGWTELQSPSTLHISSAFSYGQVRIKVTQLKSLQLTGNLRIDNIRIHRLPKLLLSSDLKLNVAKPNQSITIQCSAVGLNLEQPSVRFDLLDVYGNLLSHESVPLECQRTIQPSKPSDARRKEYYVVKNADSKDMYDGLATWQLSIPEPGFYRVRVNLGRNLQDQSLPIAVIESSGCVGGVCGWTLPENTSLETLRQIPQLTRTFGAGWLKLNVWYDERNTKYVDELAWLIERLQSQDVTCVGILSQPPASQRALFSDSREHLPAAVVFHNPTIWQPVLEPILTRMSMKLNWLQLGSDADHSFVGNPNAAKMLNEARRSMSAFSQELKLAIAWPWIDELPENTLAWDATQLSASPPLTAEELESSLGTTGSSSEWVAIDVLPANKYSLLDRVRDLTERLVSVKKAGTSAAFVSQVFDPQVGLFTAELLPTEMAVAWRTLAKNIGESEFIGSIALPSGAVNYVFDHQGEGIMLVWSDLPHAENLYLGNKLSAVDIWGTPRPLETVPSGIEQRVEVTPWPLIVRGVDLNIAKWRLNFKLKTNYLPSMVGRKQSLPLSITNSFGQSIQGKVTMVSPSLLQGGTSSTQLKIPLDRALDLDLPILVRSDASAGKHPIRFDFEINADKPYRFSTYHTLSLGFEDIEMTWQVSQLEENNWLLRLEVENKGPVDTSFDCKLFPSPYPYQQFKIPRVAVGSSTHEFTFKLPPDFINQECWIRCEEPKTGRILNYRAVFGTPTNSR